MSKIKNQVALVTGASRGMGRVYVDALLKAGAKKVYAGVRNPTDVADLVEASNGKVVALHLDVTNMDHVNAAAQNCKDVSLLVNNAGVALFQGFLSVNDSDIARQEMEINYFGTLNLIQAFAPILKVNGGGAIVNTSSVASFACFPVLGSYSASKAAVNLMTQGVRAELAAQGTQVTGVYPGPVDTDMAANVEMDKTSPQDVIARVLEAVKNGDEDVYPDPMAVEFHTNFRADPKAVEKEVGGMLPS